MCEPTSEQQSAEKHRMCILGGPTIMKILGRVLSHMCAEGRTVGKGYKSKRRLERRSERGQTTQDQVGILGSRLSACEEKWCAWVCLSKDCLGV